MTNHQFTEVPIAQSETIETPQTLEAGFAFKHSIKNKATDEQLRKLGMGWIWAEGGSCEHLRDCLTQKGWAVTPGKWKDGWKNAHKSEFIQAHLLLNCLRAVRSICQPDQRLHSISAAVRCWSASDSV